MAEAEQKLLRLMVVDDEADNLDLLYRTFRRNFNVYKANSGPKALQLLDQVGEMAIIISDQRMPYMTGTEFLSLTVERFPDTIRILLTGYTDVEDLVGAINAGQVFKYITKPWDSEDLKTIVTQAADTYRVVKQRTNELHRALRKESIFNTITTAVRESLDYRSILQTVVHTISKTFAANFGLLYPVESCTDASPSCQFSEQPFIYQAEIDPASTPLPEFDPAQLTAFLQNPTQLLPTDAETPYAQLVVPLTYQQESLAVLVLGKAALPIPWLAEDVQLIEGVVEQASLAISQAKLYQRLQKQSEQMRAELAVARQIQMNLLRQTLPELDAVKIQAHCSPAREIGGDFFETYVHPQGDLWLAVGDVSGKGVPAALFMASAISLLRRELAQETSPLPNVVMQNLNHSLLDNLVNSNCFITMVLARYTPTTGKLIYANAGHIYPLVWSQPQLLTAMQKPAPDMFEPDYLKVRGVPLGILPLWQAAAGHLTLSSGDALLLLSDGIIETTLVRSLPNGQTMLHQSGLWQLIRQQGALDLKDLLATIQAQTQIQEDDQTILSLEVL